MMFLFKRMQETYCLVQWNITHEYTFYPVLIRRIIHSNYEIQNSVTICGSSISKYWITTFKLTLHHLDLMLRIYWFIIIRFAYENQPCQCFLVQIDWPLMIICVTLVSLFLALRISISFVSFIQHEVNGKFCSWKLNYVEEHPFSFVFSKKSFLL